ncbi:membrane protein insertase YidC [Pseudothioglobus sp. nBUS_23]|uniref:membrane protein insertase YidC n=1 Tax=Pseudothioglobus sp. nBUS_23 TaxID=3395318 RepID=UPI003EBF3BB3
MNTQKLFLFIAIFLTVFLLWDKWELTQSVDENGNVITQTQLVSNDSSTETNDVPLPSDVPSAELQVSEDSTPSINEPINSGGYTTVVTDLLTLQISHKGGTIISALLNKYPETLNSEERFELLSNSPDRIFHAQSGLIPADQMPTHQDQYTSEREEYFLGGESELTVPLKWTDNNGVTVTKNFHFKPDSYVIDVDYQIDNNSSSDRVVSSYTQLAHGASQKSGGFMMGMQNFNGGAIYNDEEIFEKIDFEDFDSSPKTTSIGGWAAMIQHYFFSAWIPNEKDKHTYSTKSSRDNFLLTTVNPSSRITAGSSVNIEKNQLFIGPKEHVRLENLAPGLDKTVDYGFLFIVAKPLSVFLHWIYSFVQNWAISIILVTLAIKLAFYKLSEKSFRSMAGMKKLAPRLQKIKETYEGDKQKIGKKTMELYRTEKINPAAGCLPILVQIPVFISIYWVLIEMVELRQTPFLYLPDLAAKDPYFILPLIMGASMWFQQRLNPPPADPIQARIMQMLPIVFTVFFLWFPSGLVLYWVTNNILSIAQQMYINKKING